MACASDGMCGSGRACGPDGRCTDGSSTSAMGDDGIELGPDEEVQGGAFTCAAHRRPRRGFGVSGLLWMVGLIAGLGLWTRRS